MATCDEAHQKHACHGARIPCRARSPWDLHHYADHSLQRIWYGHCPAYAGSSITRSSPMHANCKLKVLLLAAAAVALVAVYAGAQPAGPPKMEGKGKFIIYMVDRSGSMKDLDDTTQSLICHNLKLAELSGEP